MSEEGGAPGQGQSEVTSPHVGAGDVLFDRSIDALLLAVATRRAGGQPGVEQEPISDLLVERSEAFFDAVRAADLTQRDFEELRDRSGEVIELLMGLVTVQLRISTRALMRLADLTGKSEADLLAELGDGRADAHG